MKNTIHIAPITVGDMRRALLAARQRTGDATLGHTAKGGRFQLVRVSYGAAGRSTVTALTDWADAATHLAKLQSLADRGRA